MALDIYAQYEKVYRYCYYKVKNAALAEDLTQETFPRFFSHPSYSKSNKQLAFLYVIARNLCTDTFRHRNRIQENNVSDEFLEDEMQQQQMERTELTLAIKQALKALSEEEQELLLLRYANELTVNELSEITGLSRFAVYRKTKTALGNLKKYLREEDFQ